MNLAKARAAVQKAPLKKNAVNSGMDASIIIPAYNSKGTISECIRALSSQDFTGKYEIIVVDDGSTDSTAKAAEQCGAIVLWQENCGPAKARNAGARRASANILLFTDADCICQKDWLSQMLAPFKDPQVVGVQGAYRTLQGSIVARFCQLEIEERYELMESNKGRLDWIGSYSAAYRRKDFFDANGFDESFPKASGEDPELSYRLEETGKKLVFSPRAIVYHTHPDKLGRYFWTKFYRAFYRIRLYKKHPAKMSQDSYTPLVLKVQIALAYGAIACALLVPILGFLPLAVLCTAFIASTLRLTFITVGKDFAAGLCTPFFVLVRTIAFSLGLVAGAIKEAAEK